MSLVQEPPPAASASDAPAHVHHHFELLEQAVSVALAALDYPDATAWGIAVTKALCALADADMGAVLLPGRTHWTAVSQRGDSPPVHDEATERWQRPAADDLVFWVRDDLSGRPATTSPATESGTIGLRVRSGADVAAVCVHRDPSRGEAPQHLLAALRAIATAFRAGVAAWTGASAASSAVSRMLDSLAEPALMFDVTGTLTHANPAAGQLRASADATRLHSEAQCIAWKIGASARRRGGPLAPTSRCDARPEHQIARQVRIGGTVYHLRGLLVGEQLLAQAPAVLVTIAASTSEPLSDDALRMEFNLTAREIQVARLIAEGLSNNEIAARLGVKFFTARNHVERTLAKLGVPSRTRVGPLLRNEAVEERAA